VKSINPTAAAIATVAAIVAIIATATSAADRRLIKACQTTGENVTICTLKVSGR
jgi:hypothetical protein